MENFILTVVQIYTSLQENILTTFVVVLFLCSTRHKTFIFKDFWIHYYQSQHHSLEQVKILQSYDRSIKGMTEDILCKSPFL